jgi:predicted NAD/FAD-dependent oxidoreductase
VNRTKKVAVIGAGISGLSCARILVQAGVRVTVFEKSRSFGGRCATRIWEGNVVDHGAQYFTMADPKFRSEMELLCGGELRELTAPVLDQHGAVIASEVPRWYHEGGNNRLGRVIAEGCKVRMETAVERMAPPQDDGRWALHGETFSAVVSSAPWPQTAAIFGTTTTPMVEYAPCLTAFFLYGGRFAGNSSACYARLHHSSAAAWSACENHKVGRIQGDHTVFVVQASEDFSRANLETEPMNWAALLRDELEAFWTIPKSLRLAQFTHRWRYAWRVGDEPRSVSLPPGLFVTGDTVCASRIESAWVSGKETAEAVLSWLQAC